MNEVFAAAFTADRASCRSFRQGLWFSTAALVAAVIAAGLAAM
ncbi:hypothetical protein [Acidocella sp. KAb 2-4]|nr:hypothetical protein [Acidocella sp. KAb 2-4]